MDTVVQRRDGPRRLRNYDDDSTVSDIVTISRNEE